MGDHVVPDVNLYEIVPTRKNLNWYGISVTVIWKTAAVWAFDCGCVSISENNYILRSSRNYNVMTKIPPGHAMWSLLLSKGVREALDKTGTDTIFVDVTYNVFNLDNEYVIRE